MRLGGRRSAPVFERSEFVLTANPPASRLIHSNHLVICPSGSFFRSYFLSIEKVTNTVQKHTAQEKDSLSSNYEISNLRGCVKSLFLDQIMN